MNFFYKTRGAVSIFLVIILVPMMTVSALFVDASKVKLAKGVAESAGDLALNTALTDYDTQLKDLYGLFATAQDTSELFDKLEDYYRTSITSSGVSEEDADDIVDQIMNQLMIVEESNDTADILNMELVDITVSKRANANLANAALLKKEIVDFMKYRSPINTGLKFFSALQTFKTLSKQTELVEKRTEYYKQEQTVMEKLQGAWKDIAEYNKLDIVKNENYFADMNKKLNGNESNGWKEIYKQQVNKEIIKNLYDTQDYVNYHCSVLKYDNQVEKNAAGNEKFVNGVWKVAYTYAGASSIPNYTDYYDKSKGWGEYDKDSLPTADDIKKIIEGFYKNKNEMEAYMADIKEAPANVYDLQYLVQMNRNCLNNYTIKACSVYSSYQKLKNAMIWVGGYDDAEAIENTKIKIEGIEKKLIDYYNQVTSEYEKIMDTFSKHAYTFTTISEGLPDNITDTSQVNTKVQQIGSAVNQYVETLEKGAEKLESASQKIKKAKEMVNGSLTEAKNNWETTANDKSIKNTSMARQDLAEIDELGTYLDAGYMDAMTKRLDDVAVKLRESANQIKNYKFDDTFIGDIQSYDKLKSVVESKIGSGALHKVELDNDALNSQADGWFYWDSGNLKVDWITHSGTQPNLTKDKPNFYSYLYEHFNSPDDTTGTEAAEEDNTNGKQLFKNIKEQSSKSAKNETDQVNKDSSSKVEIKDKENLPSKNPSESSAGTTPSSDVDTSEDAASNISGKLDGMFKDLSSKLVSLGADLRDNLYVSDYIMSMFSYNTIEEEHNKINETKAADKKEDKIRTLTLQEINAENNAAYKYEVEYIIYGGKNSSNITKAYGSIYGIRFAFNLIYAFSSSEIRDTAFSIATPISAATLGVIPVPLIQAAIIIGVACIESGIDLVELKQGESVPLFKNSETWHCSVKGLLNEVKNIAGDELKKAVDYSMDVATDKLNEILEMTDEEIEKNIDEIQDKLASQVNQTFDSVVTRHVDTVIQKVTTLANTAIEKHIMDPAVDAKKYIEDGLDNWLTQEAAGIDTSSDITYIIKKEAVNLIKEQYIDKLIKALEDSKNSVSDKIDKYGGEILDVVEEIRKNINQNVIAASDKVKEYKDDMKKSISDSLNGGAESLRNELNKQIDGIFGSGGEADSDNTGLASLLSFRYSDYLRLFLVIGLYANEEAILLRTADVIQVNMAKKNSGFLMKNSTVYVDIDATIQVKPTLLALPLFADVEGNPVNEEKWYTFTYKDVRGY